MHKNYCKTSEILELLEILEPPKGWFDVVSKTRNGVTERVTRIGVTSFLK